MVVAALGGFGNGSDTAFTNFERRDRELQIRIANQKRHDILYGNPDLEHKQAAAASLSTPTEHSQAAATPTSASTSA